MSDLDVIIEMLDRRQIAYHRGGYDKDTVGQRPGFTNVRLGAGDIGSGRAYLAFDEAGRLVSVEVDP